MSYGVTICKEDNFVAFGHDCVFFCELTSASVVTQLAEGCEGYGGVRVDVRNFCFFFEVLDFDVAEVRSSYFCAVGNLYS